MAKSCFTKKKGATSFVQEDISLEIFLFDSSAKCNSIYVKGSFNCTKMLSLSKISSSRVSSRKKSFFMKVEISESKRIIILNSVGRK